MVQITKQECRLFQIALSGRIIDFQKMADKELQTKGITDNYKLFLTKIDEWKKLNQDLFKRM